MTTKQLILGVTAAAAVWMAAGQANAAPVRCVDTTISAINTTPGFSCILGDGILSAFSFSPGNSTQTRNLVDFAASGDDLSIAFKADPGFGNTTNTFKFTITTTDYKIIADTVSVTHSGPTAHTTSGTITGNNSGAHTFSGTTNSFTDTLSLLPVGVNHLGSTCVTCDTSAVVSVSTAGSQLTGVTNTFGQLTPEPSTLLLFGSGLLLIGLIVSRKQAARARNIGLIDMT